MYERVHAFVFFAIGPPSRLFSPEAVASPLWRNAVKTVQRRTCLWLAAISALAVSRARADAAQPLPSQAAARAAATAAAADPAWPQRAVADPTTLGFTKAGLDALDARMKQSVADGDTAGMTYHPDSPRPGRRLQELRPADARQADGARFAVPHLLDVEADHRRRDDAALRTGQVAARRSDHQARARAREPESADLGQGRQGRDRTPTASRY